MPTPFHTCHVRLVLQRRVVLVRAHPLVCMFLLATRFPAAALDTFICQETIVYGGKILGQGFPECFPCFVVRFLIRRLTMSRPTVKMLLYHVPWNGKKIMPFLTKSAYEEVTFRSCNEYALWLYISSSARIELFESICTICVGEGLVS